MDVLGYFACFIVGSSFGAVVSLHWTNYRLGKICDLIDNNPPIAQAEPCVIRAAKGGYRVK